MEIYRSLPVLLVLLAHTAAGDDQPVRIGPGVTPPHLLKKVEPKYSPLARADRVQGTVVFQIVVDEKGNPTQLKVISPLGFGLDENAQQAIEKWRLLPA